MKLWVCLEVLGSGHAILVVTVGQQAPRLVGLDAELLSIPCVSKMDDQTCNGYYGHLPEWPLYHAVYLLQLLP